MTLFRTMDIILVAIMMSCAAITYKVKYDAQRRIGDVRQVERQIEAEKNSIHMAKAEWATLTQPQRLLQLAEHYQSQLGLTTIEPRQIVSLKDVPERLPDQIQNLINNDDIKDANEILASGRRLDFGLDRIKTGSIR